VEPGEVVIIEIPNSLGMAVSQRQAHSHFRACLLARRQHDFRYHVSGRVEMGVSLRVSIPLMRTL
jgi:hypothetical protein